VKQQQAALQTTPPQKTKVKSLSTMTSFKISKFIKQTAVIKNKQKRTKIKKGEAALQ